MVSVERPVGVEAGHLEVICSVTFGCAGPSGCGGRGASLAVVRGLLIVATSPVGEHRLSGSQASTAAAHGLGSCGSQALEHGLDSCGSQA